MVVPPPLIILQEGKGCTNGRAAPLIILQEGKGCTNGCASALDDPAQGDGSNLTDPWRWTEASSMLIMRMKLAMWPAVLCGSEAAHPCCYRYRARLNCHPLTNDNRRPAALHTLTCAPALCWSAAPL